jgi:transcriptional regulator with XRE-family HTH domain
MARWTKAGNNKLIVTESDKRIRGVLREARRAAGISQKELGERLHITSVMVSNIETGHPRGLSYVRYIPKMVAWLKACSIGLRITITPSQYEPKAGQKRIPGQGLRGIRERKKRGI